MSLAADDAELPGDPEFRAALVGYLEWGTRIAMQQLVADDADVVEHAPVPHWGWAWGTSLPAVARHPGALMGPSPPCSEHRLTNARPGRQPGRAHTIASDDTAASSTAIGGVRRL